MKIDFFSDINKENYYILDYDRIDKWLIKFSWGNAVFLVIYSFAIFLLNPASSYPSPFAWRQVEFSEALIVSTLALLTAAIVQTLRGRIANHYIYRFIMTNALMIFSYLAVFISGGSIEWHFHFFVMFAALALYSDWRLGWWAIVAVALHHGILNFVSPSWVYFYGRNDVAFLAHALIVFFMAIITTKISLNNRGLANASRLLGKELTEGAPSENESPKKN